MRAPSSVLIFRNRARPPRVEPVTMRKQKIALALPACLLLAAPAAPSKTPHENKPDPPAWEIEENAGGPGSGFDSIRSMHVKARSKNGAVTDFNCTRYSSPCEINFYSPQFPRSDRPAAKSPHPLRNVSYHKILRFFRDLPHSQSSPFFRKLPYSHTSQLFRDLPYPKISRLLNDLPRVLQLRLGTRSAVKQHDGEGFIVKHASETYTDATPPRAGSPASKSIFDRPDLNRVPGRPRLLGSAGNKSVSVYLTGKVVRKTIRKIAFAESFDWDIPLIGASFPPHAVSDEARDMLIKLMDYCISMGQCGSDSSKPPPEDKPDPPAWEIEIEEDAGGRLLFEESKFIRSMSVWARNKNGADTEFHCSHTDAACKIKFYSPQLLPRDRPAAKSPHPLRNVSYRKILRFFRDLPHSQSSPFFRKLPYSHLFELFRDLPYPYSSRFLGYFPHLLQLRLGTRSAAEQNDGERFIVKHASETYNNATPPHIGSPATKSIAARPARAHAPGRPRLISFAREQSVSVLLTGEGIENTIRKIALAESFDWDIPIIDASFPPHAVSDEARGMLKELMEYRSDGPYRTSFGTYENTSRRCKCLPGRESIGACPSPDRVRATDRPSRKY